MYVYFSLCFVIPAMHSATLSGLNDTGFFLPWLPRVYETDAMRYFASALAATQKLKDDKWILTGSHSQENIQSCTFDFIKKFVLCKACMLSHLLVHPTAGLLQK